jgi:hypoxanthine phosphoribosyltransferase
MNIAEEVARVAAEAECLHTLDEVKSTIASMAQDITAELADQHPVVLSVLNGGIFFTAE